MKSNYRVIIELKNGVILDYASRAYTSINRAMAAARVLARGHAAAWSTDWQSIGVTLIKDGAK